VAFDVGAYKWRIFSNASRVHRSTSTFSRLAQIVDVAGIHIHGIHQSGVLRGSQMILKKLRRRFARPLQRKSAAAMPVPCGRVVAVER